jgi:hypothetical protein
LQQSPTGRRSSALGPQLDRVRGNENVTLMDDFVRLVTQRNVCE